MRKPPVEILFIFVALVLSNAICFSLGGRENQVPANDHGAKEYAAKISGTIRLVGNEPFTRLVITTKDGVDYIVSDASEARRKLRDLQGREIVMEGTVRESAVFAGKDKYLGKEFIIFPAVFALMDAGPKN